MGARDLNWRRTPLGKICKIVGGSTPNSGVERYWGGEIIWVTPTDLGRNEGIYIASSERRITQEGYESCGSELVPAGSVVMSSRAPIGHLAIAQVDLCTNQGCKKFVPSDQVDSLFLYFALRHAMPDIRDLGSGATFAEVSKSQLEAFEISLPDVAEQKRIAAILNEQMAAVGKARAAAEAQGTEAARLQSAYFRQAFGGIVPLAALEADQSLPPSGWRWQTLGDIARLESGHTPSRSRPDWWGGDVPWLALPDIRNLDGLVAKETAETTNEQGLANSSARLLPENTVCLSRTASVGFVTILGRPMATSQDFVNWVCGPKLDPFFLMHLLRASRDYVRSLSSGAIHKTVYMPTVKAFRVCIPDIGEQQRIATFLNAKLKDEETLRRSIDQSSSDLSILPAVLLRHVFSGQL